MGNVIDSFLVLGLALKLLFCITSDLHFDDLINAGLSLIDLCQNLAPNLLISGFFKLLFLIYFLVSS